MSAKSSLVEIRFLPEGHPGTVQLLIHAYTQPMTMAKEEVSTRLKRLPLVQ